ncbi:hypothetical protein [Desulfobaculum bizertense]|uniref:Uncharacterized protein n=1 Tax=Desulfobaculum bizertense DSM 18034 TaxID=1121442 RepID=A0A1T4VGN7_9BACT|nr:hypothetical protein [Desulfobaculum bizertense]SKA64134.1 hypothetical protein SAMN02745702_00272 [Desulfobaculum bizertense DSM 18034]
MSGVLFSSPQVRTVSVPVPMSSQKPERTAQAKVPKEDELRKQEEQMARRRLQLGGAASQRATLGDPHPANVRKRTLG